MRYKIKTPDMDLYHEVRALLSDKVQVFAASEKRGILSTDSIPDNLMAYLKNRGVTITPEYQYDLD